MTSKEIYDNGWAIMGYNIMNNWQTFRFREEVVTIDLDYPYKERPIPWYHLFELEGLPVAKWEDVKRVYRSQVQ